jgi:two-component system sensor histidine kinase BarA
VVRAAVRAPRGRLLAERGVPENEIEGTLLFVQAIGQTGVSIADHPEQLAAADAEPLLGWAEVRVSLAESFRRQRERLLNELLILFVGLAGSLAAAVWIGLSLSRPLSELGRAMKRYRDGDLSVRVSVHGLAEFDQLAKGFNRMVWSLGASQRGLRQQVERATRELQGNLEHLSRKNAELELAREQALASSRAKDQFLARMSHEMRTPLNAVIGFGRLLHQEADTETTREYSQTLERAARLLLNVVDDVLNFARLDAGAVQLECVPFDLRECLEDAVAMLSPEAHAKGLELALVMHADIPERVDGDPGRITQVLVNLLSNAIKFTPSGYVFVEAGYLAAQEQGCDGRVRVVVSDTGIGIPAEQRERLFEPFEQGDSTITRRFGGTGLGLAICKRLLDLMGGSIGVGSPIGPGYRVEFEIPCRSATPLRPSLDHGPLSGLKVLLYDAQPIQVRALRSMLVGWGMQVFATTASERIVPMLSRQAGDAPVFDLVLLGLGTPTTNSAQLQALGDEVRRHFSGPLLLLVGAETWEPPSAFRGGETRWISKPVRRTRLFSLLCGLGGVESEARPVTAAARSDFSGRRIMVVDDNEFSRSLLRRLLELRGVEVLEAGDGTAAIRLAAESALDLVFMDIHLPGMDGIEVTRRIRSGLPAGACPAVIALSADVFAQERLSERDRVFDYFLPKPVSEAALDGALQASLNGAFSPPTIRYDDAKRSKSPLHEQLRRSAHLTPDWRARLEKEVFEQLDEIEAAINCSDREVLQSRAHDLKGLCGFFDFALLADRAHLFHQGAAEASWEDLRAQVAAFRATLEAKARGSD